MLHSDETGSAIESDLQAGVVRLYIPFGDETPRRVDQFHYFYLVKVAPFVPVLDVLGFICTQMQLPAAAF